MGDGEEICEVGNTIQRTQPVPHVTLVQCLCCGERDLNVAALQRQVEARRLIGDKVERNLHKSGG